MDVDEKVEEKNTKISFELGKLLSLVPIRFLSDRPEITSARN